jgi:hypothetical protein
MTTFDYAADHAARKASAPRDFDWPAYWAERVRYDLKAAMSAYRVTIAALAEAAGMSRQKVRERRATGLAEMSRLDAVGYDEFVRAIAARQDAKRAAYRAGARRVRLDLSQFLVSPMRRAE